MLPFALTILAASSAAALLLLGARRRRRANGTEDCLVTYGEAPPRPRIAPHRAAESWPAPEVRDFIPLQPLWSRLATDAERRAALSGRRPLPPSWAEYRTTS